MGTERLPKGEDLQEVTIRVYPPKGTWESQAPLGVKVTCALGRNGRAYKYPLYVVQAIVHSQSCPMHGLCRVIHEALQSQLDLPIGKVTSDLIVFQEQALGVSKWPG